MSKSGDLGVWGRPGGRLGAMLDPMAGQRGPSCRNRTSWLTLGTPFWGPFSAQNRPSLARGRPRASKVGSGALPGSRSDFCRFLGPALGGAMCSKYSTGYIQTTFRHLPKSHFLAPFWPPFWSLWATLGAHVGHFGDPKSATRAKSGGPKIGRKKGPKKVMQVSSRVSRPEHAVPLKSYNRTARGSQNTL